MADAEPAVRHPDSSGALGDRTQAAKIVRWRWGERECEEDLLAVEEPLELRVGGESLAVIMRTPGHDAELAAGFLLAEGVIRSGDEIGAMAYCTDPERPELRNVLNIHLSADLSQEALRGRRPFLSNSSCGVCGKASLEALKLEAAPIESGLRVPTAVLYALSDTLRAAQAVFHCTGGLHAAGLFDGQGRLLALREDVGRHNAVDKLIGRAALVGELPLDDRILMVSGRTSFEILQKAAVARIPLVAAVSAPSSLAVALAQEFGVTLVGFLRGQSLNVYSWDERVAP